VRAAASGDGRLAAGMLLSYWMPVMPETPRPSPMAKRRSEAVPFVVYCSACGAVVRQRSPYSTICPSCKRKVAMRWHTRLRIILIGSWKATTMGTLHGFNTVTNGLLIDHAFSNRAAGELVALVASSSLAVLPPLALFAPRMSIHLLLGRATLLIFFSVASLLALQLIYGDHATWAGGSELGFISRSNGAVAADPLLFWLPKAALLGMAVGGSAGPVLGLALVPCRHASGISTARSFGSLETLFIMGQAGATLLLGAARQVGGFRGALWVLLALVGVGYMMLQPLAKLDRELDDAALFNSDADEDGVQRSNSHEGLGVHGRHGLLSSLRRADRVYKSFISGGARGLSGGGSRGGTT